MKTIKMSPISYCFGVTKAIGEALKIRKLYPDSNIYFFGDLVHNEKVIEFFNSLNINVIPFNKENAIEKLEYFQKGDLVIFSAHGHNKSYEKILIDKGITFFDTTCIKVKKNLEIIKNSKKDVIFVGKNNHPETIASLSYSNKIHLYDISNNFKFDYSLDFITVKNLIDNTSIWNYDFNDYNYYSYVDFIAEDFEYNYVWLIS